MQKNVKVCKGLSCSAKGTSAILNKLESNTSLLKGQCNDKICLDVCTCTGHCHKSPNIRVDNKVVHHITPENVMVEINNPTDYSEGFEELDLDIDELTKL
jgi:NADH:ubiquinone oxidoreductase subunit E